MSNLVLQYDFEHAKISGTTISNASYGSYTLDGTLSSTNANLLNTAYSKSGTRSLYCDGNSTMYVTLPVITGLTASFTVSFWAYITGNGTTRRMVEVQMGTQIVYCAYTNTNAFIVSVGDVATTVAGITLLFNRWTYIAVTVTPTQLAVAVDGVYQTFANSITFSGTTTTSSWIGKGSADSGYMGYIDDFRIYRGALTPDQLYELYDLGTCQHYYKFGVDDLVVGSPTSATVANGYFTDPALSPGVAQYQTTLPGWTITNPNNIYLCVINANGQWGYQTPLPPNVTQWIAVQYSQFYGTFTMSQQINFDVSGGYQLTYYSAPRPNRAPYVTTITSSIAGVSRSDVALNTTTWYKFQSNITITTAGTYTLSFQTYQAAPLTGSYDSAIYIAGVSIVPYTQLNNNAFGYPVPDTPGTPSTSTNFKIDTTTYARGISSLYTAVSNAITPPVIKNADASGITVSTWIRPTPSPVLSGITNYYKLVSDDASGTLLYNYASGVGVLDASMVNGPTFGTFGTSPIRNELQFSPASAQLVQIPSYTFGNNGFTFACWFRSNDSAYYARLIDLRQNATDDLATFVIYILYNQLICQYTSSPNQFTGVSVYGPGVNDNTYRHFAITMSAKNNNMCEFKTYINGELQITSSSKPYFSSPSTPLMYASFGGRYGDTATNLNGGMFDIVLLPRPITQSEVTMLYNNPNSSNLLAPTFPSTSVVYSLNGGAYRWNLHANFSTSTSYDLSFCMYSGANTTPLRTIKQSATPILNSDISVNTVTSPVDTFSTNTWYHVLWTISPTYWKIAINNNVSYLCYYAKLVEGTIQLVAMPTTITPTILYDPSMDTTTVGYYTGNLDEFRMYNREITDNEIYKLYTYGTLRTGFYDASGNDLINQYTAGTLGTALTYYNQAGDAMSSMFSAYSAETPVVQNTIQFRSVVYDVSQVVVSANAIGDTTTSGVSQIIVGQVMSTIQVTDKPRVVSVNAVNNTVYLDASETPQTVKGQTPASTYTVTNGILTSTSFTGVAPAIGDLVFHTSIPRGTYITATYIGTMMGVMSAPDVSNGYFMIPAVSAGTIVDKTATLPDIVNWTFSGVSANMKVYIANAGTVTGTTFTAPILPDAQQYLVFSDSSTGGTANMAQSVTFVTAGVYTLTFNMAGLSNIQSGHTLTATIAGVSSGPLTATAHTWETRTLSFTVGVAGTYSLAFSTTNGGGVASAMCLTAITITQDTTSNTLVATLPYTIVLSNKTINIASSGETVKWYFTSIATFYTLSNKSPVDSGYKLYSATGYDDYVNKFGNVLLVGTPYVATGTFTPTNYANGYYLLQFTSGSGMVQFVDVSYIQVLVVGGGGGGGYNAGGGGEGGSSVFTNMYSVKNTDMYNINIGAGGTAGILSSSTQASAGQVSRFANIGVLGGAHGTSGGTGGTGNGNGGDGGNGTNTVSVTGGSGGIGQQYTIGVSTATYFGGGGGGGCSSGGTASGGTGGGGSGKPGANNGTSASNNLGGGGGGGGITADGGAGGSGVVQIYVGAVPDIPRNLVVSSKTTTTATLSFRTPRRVVTGYTLTAYANGLQITSTNLSSSATSGLINGLSPNTTYTFTLIATNAVGSSPATVTTATTLPIINAPTTIAVSQITNTTATIQLVNTDQTASAYYVVLTATGYTSPTYYTTTGLVYVTGLTANTVYTVVATAVGVSQTPSATNATATFTSGNAPDAVIRLTASSTDTTATYSFTKPTQTITSYSIKRDNLSSVYTTSGLVGVYRATPNNPYCWNNSMSSGLSAVTDAFVVGSPTFTNTNGSTYYMSLTASSSQAIVLPTLDLSNTGLSVACWVKSSASSTNNTLFCFAQYDGSLNYSMRIFTNALGYLCYNIYNPGAGTVTVTNSNFTSPSINTNTYLALNANTLTDWTWNGFESIYVANNSTAWGYTQPIPGGNTWLVMQVTTTGISSISQSISFNLPGTYTLSYSIAGRATPPNQLSVINVYASINGKQIDQYTVDSGSWVLQTLNFTITTAGSYPLSIYAARPSGSGDAAVYVTNIKIVQTLSSMTGGDIVIQSTNINDNAFRHFALTMSPTSSTTCAVNGYINGVNVYTSQNIAYPIRGITRGACYVGKSNMGSDLYWDGAVSDVMLWKRPITANNVALLYGYKTGKNAFAISPSGLIGYYLCNGTDAITSSTTATYLVNQAPTINNACFVGNPSTVTYTTYTEVLLQSKFAQYAELPSLAFSSTGFSFACMLRCNNTASTSALFEFGNANGKEAFGVVIRSNFMLNYSATDTSGVAIANQNYSVTNANNNTYNHFAITIGAVSAGVSDVIVYWNGTAVATNSLTYPIITPKMYNYVGTNSAKIAYLNGGIADVFVYTRPISSAEVTYLATNVGGSVTTTTDTSQTTAVSGTITALTTNAYYGLSVVGTNANGTSYASGTQVYTPTMQPPPTALTVGTVTTTTIPFTFTAPTTLPYWYDISAVTGSTVAYTNRLYPAICTNITMSAATTLVSNMPTNNLGFAITAPGPVRLALYSLLNASSGTSLYAFRIINGVWGTSFPLTITYNVKSASTNIINSGIAITPDGRKCIITAGSFDTSDKYVYWADMTHVLNGTTSSVSFTRIADTNARAYITVAVTNDGMRMAVSASDAVGQVYWSAWNGTNYGALTQVASSAGSYIGTAFSYDGKYLAYGKVNTDIYYLTWSGTAYVTETAIGGYSTTAHPRSIVFTYGAPYGLFVSTYYDISSVAYFSQWNGTTFTTLASTNTTNYGTGVNGWGATIDSSNILYSYAYSTSNIYSYQLTPTLTNVTSATATGLTSGFTYTINMKSFGFYGYSQASLLSATIILPPTIYFIAPSSTKLTIYYKLPQSTLTFSQLNANATYNGTSYTASTTSINTISITGLPSNASYSLVLDIVYTTATMYASYSTTTYTVGTKDLSVGVVDFSNCYIKSTPLSSLSSPPYTSPTRNYLDVSNVYFNTLDSTVNNLISSSGSAITIQYWWYVSPYAADGSSTPYRNLVGFFGTNNGYSVYYNPASISNRFSRITPCSVNEQFGVVTNAWHHITVIYNRISNASVLNYYIDGNAGNGNSCATVSTATNITILPIKNYGKQRIAELRVWNIALAANNLQRTTEVASGTANLVGLYTFNDPNNLFKNTA